MALTAEQQAQVDFQTAIATASMASQKEMESVRHSNSLEMIQIQSNSQASLASKQARLEAVRLAKETLIENSRNKPTDARDISATDITNFAQALVAYIDG